jgi:oxygen-independent coproporphyrinogen-3 oxidase
LSNGSAGHDVPLGLYVHVPFCVQRCDYCFYLSYADKTRRQRRDYVEVLLQELALYRDAPLTADRLVRFVYLGGGTPSMLDEASIEHLLRGLQAAVPWTAVEEVTFECAPRTVNEAKLAVLRQAGVTRLSMGVQTLDDEVLKLNGRVHLQADVEHAYGLVRHTGFDVVNLDLIVGLPGETDASVAGTLDRVIELTPDSVTIYQLEIPHNTPLHRAAASGHPPDTIPSWRTKRARLIRAFEQLESAGYTTRSAYAAVRDPQRHRFVYQDAQYRGADLLGIGLSSFSYLAGVHHQNLTDYDTYIQSVRAGTLPIGRAHRLGSNERLIRELVLQLKLGRVDAAYFENKFKVNIMERFMEPFLRFAERGWFDLAPESVCVTREGLARIDRLLPAFYRARHRQVPYT